MRKEIRAALLFWFLILSSGMVIMGISACIPPCPPHDPVELPEFLLGTSQGGINEVPLAAELGARWMRGQVSWVNVEREISTRELTVEDVDAHPEMITEYIVTHNWSASDSLLAKMKAYGLEPFMVVGLGNTGTLPYFQGERVTPDRLGRDNYLGHIYLYARATVERYNGDGEYDAPGDLVVKYWQLENELNQAFLEALWGWRTPSFLDAIGSAWNSWDFLTELLQTLSHAVKIEDTDAFTTVNFHTDIPAAINHGFLLPSWQESIRQWVSFVDIIGITALPNYYDAEPVKGDVLEQKVIEASEMGCGKPVVVIEACYSSGPAERGYTEDLQAQFIRDAYDAAVRGGAKGFFFFGVRTAESHSVEITQKDLDNLAYLGGLFEQENFLPLLWFVLWNMDYIQNHLLDVIWSVEPYWGLVRSDGTHKPGWDVFYSIANP